MKAPDWDESLIADHRKHLGAAGAQQAFDTLVLAAILLPTYECSPACHANIRDFRYKDRASGEWPFAFIVNRNDLIFYVRKQGVARVAGGIAALKERLSKVHENAAGEYTVHVASSAEARQLVELLFGKLQPLAALARHWWVNHRETPRFEIEGGYLWTPAKGKSESSNANCENLLEVQPGDVIFSFADGRVGALGVALGRAKEAPEPMTAQSPARKRKPAAGWQLAVRFVDVPRPLSTMEHARVLASVLPASHAPLRATGVGVRGVYLSSVPDAMVIVLRRLLDGQVEELEEKIRTSIGTDLMDDRAEEMIRMRSDLGPVEKEHLIRARRGQGLFRHNVEEIEGGCRLTQLLDRRHLVASHIKPWREADDREKLDGYNGLLFSPHVAHLFDRGYVSFTDDGGLIVSRYLNPRVLKVWHIAPATRVEAFRPEQNAYLDYHRREVFEKHDRGRRSKGEGG
jgi:hypothetical protein